MVKRLCKFSLPRFFYDTTGYTLIELLLVIIFLGIALVAIMDMMSSSMLSSVKSQILITATNLANEKMEQIIADKNNKGYNFIVASNYPDEINANGQQGYNRYVTITDYSTYKEVQVRVTHANIEDLILTTLIANY
jgi:type II secretory pathway pseudopilin PulG